MPHNRKLILSSVAIAVDASGRSPDILHNLPVLQEVGLRIGSLLTRTRFFDNAPFKWIGLIIRYGLRNSLAPEFQRINKKYGDLSITIELDAHGLIGLSKPELRRRITIATLMALVAVATKYALPDVALKAKIAKLGAKETTLS